MRQRTQEAELRGKEIPDWAGGRLRNDNLAEGEKNVQEASKTKIQAGS